MSKDARATAEERVAEIERLLRKLGRRVDGHLAVARSARDAWGAAGSLGHVAEVLAELVGERG